jgi:glycosyltransferase involved in cell wall biosynthesis
MRKNILDIKISIVISTIRPEKTLILLASLYTQLLNTNDEIIVIFDLNIDDETKKLFNVFKNTIRINMIYNCKNLGLSHNRNLGINLAKNYFVVFFDDDTIIKKNVLRKYKKRFNQGYQAVGGPLILPSFCNKLPKWLPNGLSYLLGIHTVQKRIWGGNWGIDIKFFKKHDLSFQENLGRKGSGLQSGDESNILERIRANNGKTLFDTDLAIYHCIDKKRYKISYLIRRTFWQGISEVRKSTIFKGIQKDLTRSFQVNSNVSLTVRVIQHVVGILFFTVFLIGVFVEFIFLNGRNIFKK